MLEVAKKLYSPDFFLRLNNIPNNKNATANDTRYHLKCWVKIQRKVQELDDLSTVLADIEIVNVIDELLIIGNVLDITVSIPRRITY